MPQRPNSVYRLPFAPHHCCAVLTIRKRKLSFPRFERNMVAAVDLFVHDMAQCAAIDSAIILSTAKKCFAAMGKGVMLRLYKNATTARRASTLEFTYSPASAWTGYPDVLGYLDKYDPETQALIMIGVLFSDARFPAIQSYYILGALERGTHLKVVADQNRPVVPVSPELMEPETCDGCHRSAGNVLEMTLLQYKCAHCQDAVYCSASCQAADWTERHQSECKGTARMRKEAVDLLLAGV